MAAEGKVQLNDPISKYLPKEITNWSPDTITITLEELATHQSGLPRLPSNLILQSILYNRNPYKNYSQANLYDYLKTYTPKSKPKRKVAYHTAKEKIMALVPMKNIFELLSQEEFIPIHKSYIVAKNKVEAIVRNQVLIHQQYLPISTRMRKEVLEKLTGNRLLKK